MLNPNRVPHFALNLQLEWKVEDLWVGVFWRRHPARDGVHIWLYLLPCLPVHIHIWWWRERNP